MVASLEPVPSPALQKTRINTRNLCSSVAASRSADAFFASSIENFKFFSQVKRNCAYWLIKECMANHFGQHAVVIGSLAGLMTARVLADHFDTVTVLERDRIENGPRLHQSIRQGSHVHGLLLGGQQVMASLYPGFIEKLETLGTVRCRAGRELVFYLPIGKAYSATGTVREPRDLGFDITCQSRGLLEFCVRQSSSEHSNIRFESESRAQGLVYEDGHVRGVRYHRSGKPYSLATDFVVDASGRRSAAPRWLMEFGFQAPQETTIGVDIAYASTKFRVPKDYEEPERMLLFTGHPPDFPMGQYWRSSRMIHGT
jgi:2-polyprenyl-6-methoxyphenol hydroxylase-like FAD-dependent oxidoreductase